MIDVPRHGVGSGSGSDSAWRRVLDLLRPVPGCVETEQSTELGLLSQALEAMADAAFITDLSGRIIWANEAFLRASGYSATEVIGNNPRILRSGKQETSFYRGLWQTVLAGTVWRGELIERRKDGSLYSVDEVATPLQNAAGAITHFMVVQRDITLRQREGEHERFLAYHDALTGLPNRALFLRLLEQAVTDTAHTRTRLALLYLDLDGFKPINNSLGHHIGDRLLVAVAERLNAAVRKADTVARLGGDEFVVLSTDVGEREIAAIMARKILRSIFQPFVLEGQEIRISLSVGIAMYPGDAADPTTLLRHADEAMYAAKNHGGNNYQFHGPPHVVPPAPAL